MQTTIIIALLIIAGLGALGAVGHESPNRGRNAAIVGVAAIIALSLIVIAGILI
jgi:hypothetical protein